MKEQYIALDKLPISRRQQLLKDIHELLERAWGPFPVTFVEDHVFGAHKVLVVIKDNKCAGFCAINKKVIGGKKIIYIEFLVIDPKFQKTGLGSRLFFKTMIREVLLNFLKMVSGGSVEIFFISPNIRVLSRVARFSQFTYPNPIFADKSGHIEPADDVTWGMANDLLKNSDNPNRRLDREGLVLSNSYSSTPWLIYNNDNAPWHANESINAFARRYLGYHSGEDKEFMVRAKLNLKSIYKYIFHKKK